MGTWEWDSSHEYLTQIVYTCGPFGLFRSDEGTFRSQIVAECAWNKTWVPSVLDTCQGRIFIQLMQSIAGRVVYIYI